MITKSVSSAIAVTSGYDEIITNNEITMLVIMVYFKPLIAVFLFYFLTASVS